MRRESGGGGKEGMEWESVSSHSDVYLCSKERWEMGETSLIKISIQTRKDQTTEGKEHASIRQPRSGLSRVQGTIF